MISFHMYNLSGSGCVTATWNCLCLAYIWFGVFVIGVILVQCPTVMGASYVIWLFSGAIVLGVTYFAVCWSWSVQSVLLQFETGYFMADCVLCMQLYITIYYLVYPCR
jgi:hypothetical protein